jgi:hypothetical protein
MQRPRKKSKSARCALNGGLALSNAGTFSLISGPRSRSSPLPIRMISRPRSCSAPSLLTDGATLVFDVPLGSAEVEEDASPLRRLLCAAAE